VLDALRILIGRHASGASQPPRASAAKPAAPKAASAGKGKGSNSPATQIDANDDKDKGKGKGKGKGAAAGPPADPLVRLEANHWNGTLVAVDALATTVANASAGAIIICGVVKQRGPELDNLPGNVSVALVSAASLGSDSVEVRAPARSKAGVLNISKLWITCKGPFADGWLKWGPMKTEVAIAKPPDSVVVRVQVFKAYVASKDWESFRSKVGVTDSFRAKVKHVAGDAFVDVFWAQSSC
jgi:hypothetical protein